MLAILLKLGDLGEKTGRGIYVWENGTMIFDSAVSTGRPDWETPKGVFYMSSNSATGSKYYNLIPQQQDYIAARSQS